MKIAAAYMNKIIEKEIMRAPSNISDSSPLQDRPLEKRHLLSGKCRKAFLFWHFALS